MLVAFKSVHKQIYIRTLVKLNAQIDFGVFILIYSAVDLSKR